MLLQIHDPQGILKKNGSEYKRGMGIMCLQSHRDMSVHKPCAGLNMCKLYMFTKLSSML